MPEQDSPRNRIRAEAARIGPEALASECARILGGAVDETADEALIRVLGAGTAEYVLSGHEGRYWFRVWAARGLLWNWHPRATDAVVGAFSDESWRVREMAAKVVARHLVGDALTAAAEAQADPVARVRRAAERAVAAVTEARA